jgi:hypothetical protein
LVLAVVGETADAARAKLGAIPDGYLDFFGRLPVVATPDEMAARVGAFRDAGFQYLIFIVFEPETLRLLGEQVMPTVAA